MKYLKTYEKFDKEENFDKESLKKSLERTYCHIISDKIQYFYQYLGGDTIFNPPIELRSLCRRGYVDIKVLEIKLRSKIPILIYLAKHEGKEVWEKDVSELNTTFDSFSISLEEAIQKRYPDFDEWYKIQKEADKFNL